MAAPPEEVNTESVGIAGRRSTRLVISIPVAITGVDATGHTFKENTRTLIVNKQGAKVATVHELALGAEVMLENRHLGRTGRANVVWLGDRKSSKDPFEIGLQLLEAQNIWGIAFPPDDWQEGPPIGPGGQRLEKSTVATQGPARAKPAASPAATLPLMAAVPKAAEPPPPAAKPSARAPAEVSPAALDEALAGFAKMAQVTASANLKSFEESLVKLANQVGFQTQASLQETANRIEGKAAKSLEDYFGTIDERLRSARGELDTLQAKFKELKEGAHSEVERSQQNVKDASSKALLSAIGGLEKKIRTELESASASHVQETRQRVQREADAAMETFGKEASKRLASIVTTYLYQATPELKAKQREATEQAKKEIGETIQATSAEFRESLRRMADEAARPLQTELKKSLEDTSKQLFSKIQQSLEAQAHAASQAATGSFDQSLGKMRGAIQQETEKAQKAAADHLEARLGETVGSVNLLAEEALLKLNKAYENIELGVQHESESHRKKLADAAASTLEGLERKAEDLYEGFQGKLLKAVQKLQEKSAKEISDKLQKSAEDLLDSLAKALGKHGEDTLELLGEQLKTEGRKFVAEAEEQMRAAGRGTAEEYRAGLNKTFEEVRHRGGQEFLAHLQKTAEKQREEVLAGIQRGVEESVEKAVAKARERTEKAVREASDSLNKQVGTAAVVLRDWEEHAKARMDKHTASLEASAKGALEAIRKQAEMLPQMLLERLRKDSDALASDLQARLQQAVRSFQEKSTHAIEVKLQAVTEALVETSASHLHKQTAESLDLAADGLKEKQRQAVADAEELFRNTLANMLKTVIQPGAARSTELDPSTGEEPRKRR